MSTPPDDDDAVLTSSVERQQRQLEPRNERKLAKSPFSVRAAWDRWLRRTLEDPQIAPVDDSQKITIHRVEFYFAVQGDQGPADPGRELSNRIHRALGGEAGLHMFARDAKVKYSGRSWGELPK
jgi:hypothetical protein